MRGGWQGLREVRGPVMALPSVPEMGHGHQSPSPWLLFAAGGSLFLACPTMCTSPVTALLSGETPTGLSKDLRQPLGPPRADPWTLPPP